MKFVINLPHRTDRRDEMEAQLKRVNWTAEFTSAPRPDEPGGFSSIGAHGCFLSHLQVLKLALGRRVDRLFILEDDLNFSTNFLTDWPAAEAELDRRDWSMFYPAPVNEVAHGLTAVDGATKFRCTHFVVINGPSLPMLVEGLEQILLRPPGHPLGGPMHVDGAYNTLRRQDENLKTLTYGPPLGYQRPSLSDIAELGFADRTAILRPAVAVIRKLRNALTH